MINFLNEICLKNTQITNFNTFKSNSQKLTSNIVQELTKTKHNFYKKNLKF
jgi:hypothetical protein